jgi:DNA-binding Xre family transcriptional regulator
MAAKLDYRWNLRQVMASRGMFATTGLAAPLAERGISLSASQVYRLVTERPERLSLKALMALLDILDCTMEELIEPAAAAGRARSARRRAARTAVSATCAPDGPASPRPAADQ